MSRLADHLVTREEVEACCSGRAMAQEWKDVPAAGRQSLIAGIDWGGGASSRTVIVIGYIQNDRFIVVHIERYHVREEPDAILRLVAAKCRLFRARAVSANAGGNGSIYNNLLLKDLTSIERMYGITYAVADQQPQQYKGRLYRWSIERTPSLGMVFTHVKNRRLDLPRLTDSAPFIDEIWCETAEYDDAQRTIKYTHPESQPDDVLHAINLGSTLARYIHDVTAFYSE